MDIVIKDSAANLVDLSVYFWANVLKFVLKRSLRYCLVMIFSCLFALCRAPKQRINENSRFRGAKCVGQDQENES